MLYEVFIGDLQKLSFIKSSDTVCKLVYVFIIYIQAVLPYNEKCLLITLYI